MKTVQQLLEVRPHDIWSVTTDSSVYVASKLMADKNVGAILVLEAGKLVGILSERDCARKVILTGRPSKDTLVGNIMTTSVICAHHEQTVEECMILMIEKHVRHLPALKDDQLIGMLSIEDIVKSIISEKEFIIKQLDHYITTGRS